MGFEGASNTMDLMLWNGQVCVSGIMKRIGLNAGRCYDIAAVKFGVVPVNITAPYPCDVSLNIKCGYYLSDIPATLVG
jgi:hypothetical protein